MYLLNDGFNYEDSFGQKRNNQRCFTVHWVRYIAYLGLFAIWFQDKGFFALK